MECNVPVDVLSIKLGIHTARAGGKQSRTVFERMSFNGKTSVVKCTSDILCTFVVTFVLCSNYSFVPAYVSYFLLFLFNFVLGYIIANNILNFTGF